MEEPKKQEEETMRKHRVSFDFSEEAFQELVSLEERVENPSILEVVRCGIGMVRWASNKLWEESQIIVRKKDGTEYEMEFSFLKKPPTSEETPPAA